MSYRAPVSLPCGRQQPALISNTIYELARPPETVRRIHGSDCREWRATKGAKTGDAFWALRIRRLSRAAAARETDRLERGEIGYKVLPVLPAHIFGSSEEFVEYVSATEKS